jgi:phosphatidate cytidylyltransferase
VTAFGVPVNVVWAIGGIFVLLALASLILLVLGLARPSLDLAELKARTLSWWGMAILFAVAILLSRTVSLVFFAVVSFLALKEYFSLIPTRRADRGVLLFAYLAIPIQFYWIGIGWYGMFIIFVPVYMFLFMPVPMLVIGETQGFLRAVGTIHWGLMSTVYTVSHAAYLLALPPAGNPVAHGEGLLLFLVLLTEGNDIAQYFWGKGIGRRRIIPRVSPKKTWEGFVGGVLTTMLLGVLLAPWLTPFDLIHAVMAGLLIGLAGFAGDLTISAMKRDLGIKDSGTILPGHGGILDRLDSLTYTAPLFFHFTRYFYY